MKCVRIDGGILCLGHGVNRVIKVRGRVFHFEMDDRWGPTPINKRGDVTDARLPNYALEAITLWHQQGQRVDDAGRCLWHHEAQPVGYELPGGDFMVTGMGLTPPDEPLPAEGARRSPQVMGSGGCTKERA